MVWHQIEASPPHLSYLLLSAFLLCYVLFANFLRNRLHLSEPPLALVFGIIIGPEVLGWITPNHCGSNGCKDASRMPNMAGNIEGGWGWGDNVIQEMTRVIVGIQVFAVGVQLPKYARSFRLFSGRYYAERHWRSILMMLGPVMTFSWLICAVFCYFIFNTDVATSLTISACLTPTDPVLAASILSSSRFSDRIPRRLKDLLSAESGCNDGMSFPFLWIGLFLLTQPTAGQALKEWFLVTILWECVFGLFIGLVIGVVFNRILRKGYGEGLMDKSGFIVFYLLASIFCIGVGSTLGSDDFLVAFGAGYGFARDGWFAKKTKEAHLPHIIDLLLNNAFFIYLGTILPWYAYSPQLITPWLTPGRLIGFLALVLVFRRIPVVLAMYRWTPDIKTAREALFCGHFGPMGLGALFLAIQGRAVLENGTATPDPHPPDFTKPFSPREKAIETIWPVVSFVVFGSTLVHGLSVPAISLYSHLSRKKEARAGVLAGETEALGGMEHGDSYGESEGEDEATDEEQEPATPIRM